MEGFLLAICLSGSAKPMGVLTKLVWEAEGGEAFANEGEEREWLVCLREFYGRIEEGLVEGNYQPRLSVWPDAEDSMDEEAPYFSPWLDGFLKGSMLVGSEVMEGGFDDDEAGILGFLAMEMIEEEEKGRRLLEDDEENPIFQFMELVQSQFLTREKREGFVASGRGGKGGA